MNISEAELIWEPDAHFGNRKRPTAREKEQNRLDFGGLKNFRWARMKQDVKGRFTRWRKGERVKARQNHGGTESSYTIEKAKTTYPFLPLLSQCVGVPKNMLEFIR